MLYGYRPLIMVIIMGRFRAFVLDLRDCGATWKSSSQNNQTPVARIHLDYFLLACFFFLKFVAIRFREKCFVYIIQIFSNKEHVTIYVTLFEICTLCV